MTATAENLLRWLSSNEPATLADVDARFAASRTATDSALADLRRLGLIQNCGTIQTGRVGRPRILIERAG